MGSRSEKLELSEDFATEAACRMKQFEDDEEETASFFFTKAFHLLFL